MRSDEDIEDPALYGVDWEAAEDSDLLRHLFENNPQDNVDSGNPFSAGPAQLSEVRCDPPNSPLSADEVSHLDALLSQRVDIYSRSMNICRLVWIEALGVCQQMFVP